MKIATYDSLNSLPADFASRFRFESIGRFFLSIEWFSCLDEAAISDSHRIRIYTVVSKQSGDPLALAMCCQPQGRRCLNSFTNYYSWEYRPTVLLDRKDTRDPISDLVRFIAAERPRWRSANFDYLRSDYACASQIANALDEQGFVVTRNFRYENWYLPTQGADFKTFFEARPSRLRNTIARREKKLLKSHRVDFRLFAESGEALEQGCADYLAVYENSWKRNEPFPRFIPLLLRRCASLGILRLGVLYVDSVPAAAQIWITDGGTALIYKLAYDERFKGLSPGSLLSREMFRIALDHDKVREVDYGVGSEGYKKDWMTHMRTFERVSGHNLKQPAGLALASVQTGKRMLKRVSGTIRSRSSR